MPNTFDPRFSPAPRTSPQKPKPAAALVFFALAALFFYWAGHEYDYFAQWEKVGGTKYMNTIIIMIYEIAGKTGVVTLFVVAGFFMVFCGFVIIYKLIRR